MSAGRVPLLPALVCLEGLFALGCGRFGFDPSGATDPDAFVAAVDAPDASPVSCGLRAIEVGGTSTCVINGDGLVSCWGGLGGLTPTTVDVGGPSRSLVMGHGHACVLRADGRVRCWGAGHDGVLGDGLALTSDLPVSPVGDPTFVDLAAGPFSMCGIRDDGEAMCWGRAYLGALGDGRNDNAVIETAPQIVPRGSIARFRGITGDQGGFCADSVDDRRYCWGSSAWADDFGADFVPTEVIATGELGVGRRIGCALTEGTLTCRGRTETGDLGSGAYEVMAPALVPVLTEVRSMAIGHRGSCAVRTDNSAWCWGSNRSGEVGDGTLTAAPAPKQIALPPVAAVATGFAHSCADTSDGVYCWGTNGQGQLGRSGAGYDLDGGAVPPLPAAVTQVALGGDFGCARLADDTVWCWGQNLWGQAGGADRATVATATQIPLGFVPNGISAGSRSACAFDAGQVWCWGRNERGYELGDPGAGPFSAAPVRVPLPTGQVSSVRSGPLGSCAIVGDTGYCWGAHFDHAAGLFVEHGPQAIGGVPPISRLTSLVLAAEHHVCAQTVDERVFCWGGNAYRQADPSASASMVATPVEVPLPGTVIDLAVTNSGSCALLDINNTNEVYCWGLLGSTQLDDPTAQTLPAEPRALIAYAASLCVLLENGERACVGSNRRGLFGDGTTVFGVDFRTIPRVADDFVISDEVGCELTGGVVTCFGDPRHGAMGGRPPGATPARVAGVCE